MKRENLRTALSKVKGLGAAGTGTAGWIAQRVSAVALIPLVMWFVYFMIKAIEYKDLEIITSLFISPFCTIFLSLFISIGIYHGNLGMKEIVEDYVHCHMMKSFIVILLNLFSLLTAIAGVCAVLVLHLSTFSVN